MKPIIERYEQLSGTPARDLAMDGFNLLRVNGWIDTASCGLDWNDKALLARLEGRPVGVLTYKEQDWKCGIFITVGYVHRDYQRQGIYTALWQELCQIAREKKLYRIEGGVSAGNLPMEAFMAKAHRKAIATTYEYLVTPDAEAQAEVLAPEQEATPPVNGRDEG